MIYFSSVSRCFFTITFLVLISPYNFAQISSTGHSRKIDKDYQFIYLVRHAEKAADGSKDPSLTDEGMYRAQRLSELLRISNIGKIYSTDFKRTRDTAQPLSTLLGIVTEIYDPGNDEFLQRIKSYPENMLIVGHSNTTPALVNALLGHDIYKQLIDATEYDKLFIVSKVGKVYGSAIYQY